MALMMGSMGRRIQQGVDESTYGKGACIAWDNNTLSCGGNACPSNDIAAWCYSAWCYVDPYKCNLDWQLSEYFPSSGRAFSYAACGELNSYSSGAAGEAALNAMRGRVLRVGRRASTGGWRGAYHVNGKSRLSPTPETGWYGPLSELFEHISTPHNNTQHHHSLRRLLLRHRGALLRPRDGTAPS